MANLTDFISDDFASVFLMGFAAGFILMATIYLVRAVVKIAIRIMRGRQ